MKYKKSLLALGIFGIGASLICAHDTYAAGKWSDVQVDCSSGTYKVANDYDGTTPTKFKITCPSLTFDLNGKKINQGAIVYDSGEAGKLTLIDSVGNGYIKSWTGGAVGAETPDTVIETAATALNIQSGNYDGLIDLRGSTTVVAGGAISGTISVAKTANLQITGGEISSSISGEGTISISGGTFSAKPDEKYLSPGYATYEVTGKYVVDRSFMLTNFFQYMYVGQTNEAYISPAIVSKTAKVTSSDESVLSISCKDSTKLLGQMMMESEDIISKACTITAKKAGKAVLSYTADYGYKGDITVHVANIDATSYGDDADSAKYELTARYLSVYVADPVEYAWYTTAPSAVGSDWGTFLDNVRKQFASLVSSIDAGHAIKLELSTENSTISEEEQALLDGKNVAAVYTVSGSITDATDKKTIVSDWRSDISSLPLPEILKNRDGSVQIAAFIKDSTSNETKVSLIDAEIKGDSINIINATPGAIRNLWPSYYKFAILYDGEPLTTSGSLPDTAPKAPNTSSQPESVAIILGASAAIGLPLISVIIYLARRKATARKLRF